MKYCPDESLIWSTCSPVQCIFMHPVHSYVSESQSYKPYDYNDHMRPRATRDFCVSKEGNPVTIYYCGAFRCVGTLEVTTGELIELGLPPQVRSYVASELTSFGTHNLSRRALGLMYSSTTSLYPEPFRRTVGSQCANSFDRHVTRARSSYAATSSNISHGTKPSAGFSLNAHLVRQLDR